MNANPNFIAKFTDEHLAAFAADPTKIDEPTRLALIGEWQAENAKAKAAVAREMVLRKICVGALFPTNDALPKGTKNFNFGNGWIAKAEFKVNCSVDNEKADAALDALEKCGEDGKFLAEHIFRTKYELSATEYKKLNDKQRAIIDEVLSYKPASPTLELVPPKAS